MRLISLVKRSLLILAGVLLFSQLILGTHSFLSDDQVGAAVFLVDDFLLPELPITYYYYYGADEL
jgi:hypothetical protein